MPGVHIIERAFQLACGGEFANRTAIAKRLSDEGYPMVGQHLDGHSIRQQLISACRKARSISD